MFTNATNKLRSLVMNGPADVDGFKLCIQVCMWLGFPPLKIPLGNFYLLIVLMKSTTLYPILIVLMKSTTLYPILIVLMKSTTLYPILSNQPMNPT